MNFQTMEYFTVLANVRNFTHAAEILHITQQSLSSSIATLEQELGCQMFIRRKPLDLTYAGRIFLRYAKDYQTMASDMKREFNDIAENKQGELRIGCGYTHSMLLLPPVIHYFQKQWPGLQISVQEGDEVKLIDGLVNDRLDLIFKNFDRHLPTLIYQDYFDEKVVLLIPAMICRRFQWSIEQIRLSALNGNVSFLQGVPILQNGYRGISGRTAAQLFSKSHVTPDIKVSSNNINTLLSLCTQNEGALFAPLNMVFSGLSSEQLSKVHIFHLPTEYHYKVEFAYQSEGYEWSALPEFIRMAVELHHTSL